MSASNLSIRVKERSHLSRIVFGLRLHIMIISGVILFGFYKYDLRTTLISALILILAGIGFPLLLGFSFYRFYIIELVQEDNILKIKIMDIDKVLDYQVDLNNTKIELSKMGSKVDSYRLDFYEGDKRLFYQVNLFDWDKDKLKEVYEKLKGYYTGK